MAAPDLLGDLPGTPSGEFAAACATASAALRVMRDLVSGADGFDATDLLNQFDSASAVGREVDLVVARMGREIEHRSEEAPAGGLARRCGHRSTAELMAARRGSTRAEAVRLLTIGRLLEDAELAASGPGDAGTAGAWAAGADPGDADRNGVAGAGHGDAPGVDAGTGRALSADSGRGDGAADAWSAAPPDPTRAPAPGLGSAPGSGSAPGRGSEAPTCPHPRNPQVTAALAAGELSVECASQITAMLADLDGAVDPRRLADAEGTLVRKARGLAADRFARIVRQTRARLDPDGHERELAAMRRARMLRIYDNRAGMTVVNALLDPETAAPLRTAIDAIVGDAMRRSQDAVGGDTRTADQMRADALADIARHALGCSATELPLATVTMVVRIDEESLRARTAQAELEGSSIPLDAASVRRMAAGADIIPAVLGGAGEVLDLGRSRRLFTKAQRLALGERDGGCAFCGAPPGWTEVHHIRWWGRDLGRTDVANGVLLCRHCHQTVHSQGWEISATPTEVWFTPPVSVDPDRRPRQGGRARFHANPERVGEHETARTGDTEIEHRTRRVLEREGLRRRRP